MYFFFASHFFPAVGSPMEKECTPPDASGHRTTCVQRLPAPATFTRRSLVPLACLPTPNPNKASSTRFDSQAHSLVSCAILGHVDRVSEEVQEVEAHVATLGSYLRFSHPMGSLATLLLRRAVTLHPSPFPSLRPALIDCADVELILVCMIVAFKLTRGERIQLKRVTSDCDRWMKIEAFLLRCVSFSVLDLVFTSIEEHCYVAKLRSRLHCSDTSE